ncbi:MAG TPA: uracil-DNA glycosylase family protein [Ktedonobacterales bacterium]|jgi:uracil-DNA glycosylase|nr:uracil-DNA glycosylase family protein [Ktedonobacterales bacterium]
MTSATPHGTRALPLIDVLPPLPASTNTAERERLLAALHQNIRACRLCVLAGYLAEANTVAGTRGQLGDRVMVVGQAPGHLSVERGTPFSGPGGRILDQWLQRAGFAPGALHREVYISAITRCDPGKNPRGSGDRKPSPPEVALCRPYLLRELELVRPEVILLVGGMAISAFLGPSRLEEVIGVSFERNGVHILPLPHPSGVSHWLNDPQHQALLAQALALLDGWRRAWEDEGL